MTKLNVTTGLFPVFSIETSILYRKQYIILVKKLHYKRHYHGQIFFTPTFERCLQGKCADSNTEESYFPIGAEKGTENLRLRVYFL